MRGSVLVIDLTTDPGEALRLTALVSRGLLANSILIMGSQPEAELEWPFLELGAHAFLLDSLRGEALAKICLRQFEHCKVRY